MRNTDHSPVKDQLTFMVSADELHFYYTLLTRLRADDLVDEDSRRRAVEVLYPRWLLAREVTGKQSSVSQGEHT